jgi:hypothetical protein
MNIPMAELRRWQDWTSFVLGLWLAVSPWLADYAGHDVATANAAVCGLALALAAHLGVSFGHLSTHWLTLGAGLWLIAAPFALGFSGEHVAAANTFAVGCFVALLSAGALELDRGLGRLWHRIIAGH